MKNLFILLFVFISFGAYSQDKPTAVKDTVLNAVTYKLYKGSKGGKYIIRVSKVSGKEYKQYFKSK